MAEGKSEEKLIEKMLISNLYILSATIFWGVNYAFTKALISEWMSSNGVAVVRLIGGCILFWLTSIFIKKEKIARQDMLQVFFAGFVGLFSCIYFFVSALKYGSAIDVSIISTLPPAWVILIETIFLHKRPSWLVYSGIVISFCGAALVILTGNHAPSPTASNYLLGDFFALLCSMCFAIYLVLLSKPTDKYNPIILLRWVFLFAALPALLLVPGMQDMPLVECRQIIPWLEISFILLGPTFLAYLLTQPAVRNIGSVAVSLYQYLTPVVAAISAVLMGVDHLRWMQVIAILIIVAGMILTNVGQRKK